MISKKDFLKITGISYGQLYRWKRENLIPERWFVKRSSFTGQETFLPKDKILKRVKMIQELKDQYSLEEMAAILSPELSKRNFNIDDIMKIPYMDTDIVQLFQKSLKHDYLRFTELMFAYTLSKAKHELEFEQRFVKGMVISICSWLKEVKSDVYRFLVCENAANIFILLLEQNTAFFMGNTVKVLRVFHLDEISGQLNEHLTGIMED